MTDLAPTLFDAPPRPVVDGLPAGEMILRDYQSQDADAIVMAWESGKRAVMCRHATGMGKSVLIAEMARRRMHKGRVLVTVDVGLLAQDLAKTIYRHIGGSGTVGVLTGDLKDNYESARVVVSTVQTLYAGGLLNEWFKAFDPKEFATVLVDEAESSIADRFGDVLRHFYLGNEECGFAGLTATPFRADGRQMGEFWDHACNEPGPLNRDILWARDNGWLVHVKQAFIKVSLDFSTLTLRKNDEGVLDYSEQDLAKMLEDEASLRELAIGIHRFATGEPSIIICPNDVSVAQKLAFHLDSVAGVGSAHAVYGEQGQRAKDLIKAYQRGAYPYITSVAMLYKGFDADIVRNVFMCRKTRSRRLYEQAMGRGTRPLIGIRGALSDAADAASRRKIIAESAKPHMVMVDMVGVHEEAKDLGVIDILGEVLPVEVRERAKKEMLASDKPDEAQETEAAARKADGEIAEEKRVAEETEKKKRAAVLVDAHVDIEETDDLSARGGAATSSAGELSQWYREALEMGKVPAAVLARLDTKQKKRLASELFRRRKKGLCTFGQGKALLRSGYTKGEIKELKIKDASKLIEAAKANGWKRTTPLPPPAAIEPELAW